VEGPPGIGKTRLLVETARMGAAQGRTMVHVACGRDATSGLQLVADLRDALGMADRGTPTFDDAAVRRFTARQELRERLDVVGDVVVLADDLHWIDDESADLLVHLITRATSTRWVLALRSDPARPAARRLLDEIEREVRPDVLHPTPLAPGDIRRLADDLGITLDDPERDVERVADVSVGNPLLAVELLRAGGAIDPEGEVPDRVASLVGARLAEVDPLGRSLAAVVAVAGGATHRTTAGEVLGVEPREIDRTASSLREAGVLEGAPGGHLVIRHDLVRRAVLQRLDQSEVVRLRHDLVAALAPAGADDPAVAHHLFELGADRSDEQDDLLDLVVGRAVDELYAASDYGAAYELADRYLTEVGTVRTAHAATVTLLHVVTVLMGTGDPRAAALHRIVLERSSGLSDPRLRAGVLLASGPIETGAATSRDTIGEIVGLLDVLDPDDPRWVQLAAWAAHLHLNLGELEPATDLLRRAERHLAVRPRPAQEGLLLSLRVQATWLEASDDRGEALEQFSAHYHLTRDQISEAGLGLVALGRGFVDGTLDDVDDQRCALDRLARRVPRPDMRWWVHASSAAVLMARGDEHTAEAIATAEAAGAIGPVAIAGGTARLQQTWNTWQAGSLGGIAELVGRFAERPDPDAVALAVWAAALVQAGDAQQAAAVADRLVACHRPLRRAAMTWPVVAVLGAHVADATQHRALADVIGPALERRRGRGLAVHAAVYCGTADLALGLVRRAQGDLDEARTHWERATDLELVRGSTWWADHAAALLAEV
jgi:tetratricopeptide (TPR) repeat protein